MISGDHKCHNKMNFELKDVGSRLKEGTISSKISRRIAEKYREAQEARDTRDSAAIRKV